MDEQLDAAGRLWDHHISVFRRWDDLTLARWMSQTLSQLQGGLWRMSHPLVGAYRLAAQAGHERDVWQKRLLDPPPDYSLAECCRSPLLPMATRDVLEQGLICVHCNGTALPLSGLTENKVSLESWGNAYASVHHVAHWEEEEKAQSGDYDQAFEHAASEAERLLAKLGNELAPQLVDGLPALLWEDQDECLQVRPEDVPL